MSLAPLKSVDKLECTVPLGVPNSSIDVVIQLEKVPAASSQKPHPPSQSHPATASHTKEDKVPQQRGQGSGEKAEAQLRPSAKRNLTQSFEDASLATNSSVTSE